MITIDAPDVHAGQGWLEHTLSLQMKDGRILEARSSRLLTSDVRTGLVDPYRLADDLEYENPGISAPRSTSSLTATSSNGVVWVISYVTDSLESVRISAWLWPNKERNADMVLPSREGINKLLTAEG